MHSKATTNPFPLAVLRMLQESIPYFYTEDDAKSRSDFYSTAKRLCIRLHHTIVRLRKSDTLFNSHSEALKQREKVQLTKHLEFVQWLFEFSCAELQPTASYQRHVTSLKVLHLMLKSQLLAASQVISSAYSCEIN